MPASMCQGSPAAISPSIFMESCWECYQCLSYVILTLYTYFREKTLKHLKKPWIYFLASIRFRVTFRGPFFSSSDFEIFELKFFFQNVLEMWK